MNINFTEPKDIKINGGMKKISVKTIDENPLQIITKKCDSFGVKKDERFDTKSISIILDDNSIDQIKKIISNCEEHLEKPLSKILYERDHGTVTIYPKIRDRSVFYDENGEEIDPLKYERKYCEIKAVLEIEGILLKEEKVSLQGMVYEAIYGSQKSSRSNIGHGVVNK